MSSHPRALRRVARRASVRRFPNAFALLLLAIVLGAGVVHGAEPPPLDLNRATAEELEALPGIGAVKAAAILAVREERGGFQSLDELESVRGIGPKLAQQLRPMLRVGEAKAGGAAARAGSGPGSAKP